MTTNTNNNEWVLAVEQVGGPEGQKQRFKQEQLLAGVTTDEKQVDDDTSWNLGKLVLHF